MIKEFQGKFRWLSNFWLCAIYHEGYTYPSVEHAYQACKMAVTVQRTLFLDSSPGDAKRTARAYQTREDWKEIKRDIMFELVHKKFFVHETLKQRLIATGAEVLEEGNKWHDTYWGVDLSTGQGQNNLGLILMEVRDMLAVTS